MSKIRLVRLDNQTLSSEQSFGSNNVKANTLSKLNNEALKQIYGGRCTDHTPEELTFIIAFANEPHSRGLQAAICRGDNTVITAIEFGSGATNNTAVIQFV